MGGVPSPVWPRDYPDTECGRRYWLVGSGGGGGSEGGEEGDWRLVRYCVEEGTRCGGRIKTELKGVMRGMTSGGSSVGAL